MMFGLFLLAVAPVSINISLDDGNDSLVVAADDVFPVAAGRTNYDVICVFEAMPDPFLYELRRVNESESILVNNATSSQSFSLRSRLPMLTVAESGVMFECAATNDLGRGSATFSIRVQGNLVSAVCVWVGGGGCVWQCVCVAVICMAVMCVAVMCVAVMCVNVMCVNVMCVNMGAKINTYLAYPKV